MKINKQNKLRDLVIRKLQGLVYRLDNTGNGDFSNNGEASFLQDVGDQFRDKKFIAFDIGANIGEYTDMLLKYVDTTDIEIHLFEPQKSCFENISDKFSANKNIYLNNFGLSDAEEDTFLYKDFDQSGLASVHKRNLSHYNMEMNEKESINLKTAETYMVEHNIKKIDLIKIDIEGHELSALKGFGKLLNAETVNLIQFEYGGANLDSHTSLLDLFTFFESKGFIVCKMMKHGLEKQTYKPRFENFMYQNWVAISPELLGNHIL